jgi:exodeoxyribonuclease VII small subunit
VSGKTKRQRKKSEQAEPTFEEALERLEKIAGRLESGDLALEEAIALAEEGLGLSRFCEKQLAEEEGKIQQLVERMGAVGLEPLEVADEQEEEEEA